MRREDSKHISRHNPRGIVEYCDKKKPHAAHEYQPEFGSYVNYYCEGFAKPVVVQGKTITEDRLHELLVKQAEGYIEGLRDAMGMDGSLTWSKMLELVRTQNGRW